MRNQKIKRLVGVIAIGFFSVCWSAPEVMAAPHQETPESQIVVGRYRFDDETIASNDELKILLADQIGKSETFKDLEKQADKVTRYLRSKGYLVAFAYIPPQDFKAGSKLRSNQDGTIKSLLTTKQKFMKKPSGASLAKSKRMPS